MSAVKDFKKQANSISNIAAILYLAILEITAPANVYDIIKQKRIKPNPQNNGNNIEPKNKAMGNQQYPQFSGGDPPICHTF